MSRCISGLPLRALHGVCPPGFDRLFHNHPAYVYRLLMEAKLVLLPGDGIGPEIISEAKRLLEAIAPKFGLTFHMQQHLIGGIAIDQCGDPLPQQTIDACKQSAAVLLGAVGGPKWDDPTAKTRPEVGLLKIRKELQLFANLRPIQTWDELVGASPLKHEIVSGTDILFFRELTGGIYFGQSGRRQTELGEAGYDEMIYSTTEVERIVRLAAAAAVQRKNKLTSVDKANVLESSRVWRQTAERIMRDEFPNVDYEVVLVDAMAMHLISRPKDFDVVVTGNMFGDILTDAASMLPGSLGMLPSASIGSSGPGLYEPIHGSAPDIAGKGIANPLATFLATAMMLRHSLQLEEPARAIEDAVAATLAAGHRTKDIAGGGASVSTSEMSNLVIANLA